MASFGDLPTEVAQKCVEFLAFDEAIEVKSVSRGLRGAARRALTRGRWRPIRFVSEHGLATLRTCRDLNSLDDGAVATFRAAWALDPGLVMRVIREDMVDDQYRDDHNDAIQSIFLNIVEPSMEGIPRILAACEGLYRKLYGNRELHGKWDNGRPLFSPWYMLYQWAMQVNNRATCSETSALIHVHLRCSVDFGLRVRLQDYLWGIKLSLVFPGLESWADAKLAATLLDEFRSLVTVQTPDPRRRLLVGVARMWSLNWQDRDKAELFVAEAERIQHVFRSAGPGTTWDY